MTSRTIRLGGLEVLLLDELLDSAVDESDYVLVTGSFAGLGSARKTLKRPPRLAVFSDAGVGKDRAGVAGLELLEAFNIPAAAVDVNSARIGDADDTLESGVLAHCNGLARELGLEPGMSVRQALEKLEG